MKAPKVHVSNVHLDNLTCLQNVQKIVLQSILNVITKVIIIEFVKMTEILLMNGNGLLDLFTSLKDMKLNCGQTLIGLIKKDVSKKILIA